MSRAKLKAQPFDGLLGLVPTRLPNGPSVQVVVAGKPVTDLREVDAAAGDDEELRAELRHAVVQARNRRRYQVQRQDAETMAEREARQLAAKEARKAYMRRYRAENHDRIRELQRNWEKRHYHQDPLAAAAARRAEYHANREKERALARARYQRNRVAILARLAARREEKRAALAAAAAPAHPMTQPAPERT